MCQRACLGMYIVAYMHICRSHTKMKELSAKIQSVCCASASIEDNYHDSNPYHNIIHATDVTQAMYCYLQEKKVGKLYMCG